MQRLKGRAFLVPIDENKNKYEMRITIEGFQNYESVKRFKRSSKCLYFYDGLLFLVAGGVIVTLTPDEQMIKRDRKPLEARRLLVLQHDQGRRVVD
ncbi:hypothetical protein ADMFC3_23620 [Geovibrio sp. ADMFC3]